MIQLIDNDTLVCKNKVKIAPHVVFIHNTI